MPSIQLQKEKKGGGEREETDREIKTRSWTKIFAQMRALHEHAYTHINKQTNKQTKANEWTYGQTERNIDIRLHQKLTQRLL